MRAAESRDLGQMGDADDLPVECPHFLHDMCHLLGDAAGDAGIYFVENDGRQFDRPGNHGFQRKHDACDFTPRCHLGDRLQLAVFVGTEKEVYFVGSCLVRYFFGSEFHFELDVRDAQRDEFFFHLPFHDQSCLLP